MIEKINNKKNSLSVAGIATEITNMNLWKQFNDKLLTPDEMQALLNIGKTKLYLLRKEGLPFIRTGRKILYLKSEVIEFLRIQYQSRL